MNDIPRSYLAARAALPPTRLVPAWLALALDAESGEQASAIAALWTARHPAVVREDGSTGIDDRHEAIRRPARTAPRGRRHQQRPHRRHRPLDRPVVLWRGSPVGRPRPPRTPGPRRPHRPPLPVPARPQRAQPALEEVLLQTTLRPRPGESLPGTESCAECSEYAGCFEGGRGAVESSHPVGSTIRPPPVE